MSAATPIGADPNTGWKFHLNFDVDDPNAVAQVRRCAAALQRDGLLMAFKIGNGGGGTTGDNRKEATLYAGSMDNALLVAERLESELEDVLLPPDRTTMLDDVPMTASGRTWARFTARSGLTGEYHQYGSRGICHLKTDMEPSAWGQPRDPARARVNALNALEADFKTYFTGSRREIDAVLARSDRVELSGTLAVFGWEPADDIPYGVTLSERELQWWRGIPGATWNGARHAPPKSPEPWWLDVPDCDGRSGLA